MAEVEVVIFKCLRCGFIAMFDVDHVKYKPMTDSPKNVCPMCMSYKWKKVS